MNKKKTKIPIVTISIIDSLGGSNVKGFDNPLFKLEQLKNVSKVAQLSLHKVDHHLYPASAELFWIKNVKDEAIDGEDGISFQFKPAEVLESGSFEVEYCYDSEIGNEIPKYIIIN
ncbi:MAG: hypothetical protein DAHOPDDO_00859 [Ignavibacteriaceae bacterium]|nr:hypothetical protein [Ignavibacteriaceae bacterium]